MKTTLRILMVLLALCAVRAQAAYSIGVTASGTQSAIPGQSGTSYFDFTFNGGGTFTYSGKQLYAVEGNDPDHNSLGTTGSDSPFSRLIVDPSSTLLLGAGNTYTSGQTYRLVVDWTVKQTWNVTDQYGIYFNLFTLQPDGLPANAGATDRVNINTAAVPEPPQILAGSVVLGVGLLLGIGRRLFKKPLV